MLTILFGMLVGLSLGLTGGGGSIIAVPLLIIGLQVTPLQATTISLAAVAVTSAYGSLVAGYARMIEWRAALIMVAAGMVTAPVGVNAGTGGTVTVYRYRIFHSDGGGSITDGVENLAESGQCQCRQGPLNR